MPSFDVVSEVDIHELANAVDQANREVGNRFDFKGTDSRFELKELEVSSMSESEFQLQQMLDILQNKMVKRSIDIGCLDVKPPVTSGKHVSQQVVVQHGIDKELARKIVKIVKDSKVKVQAAIQGEQVRITGKKRDDLQQVITVLKEAKLGLPLQYTNFRD
ncbi:MAG: YajQ family cyclic di-GMP-binding protein [Gammaproteobacteria bacterium]|nr:YajQ family cyclic di-GMP-binding protein [Gammaproteobacteria bacterium]